ncbi:M3 family oligoendopeptidase [Dictyobacter aurantiacus]|uniref:Oligoendopeptidase F n=1 Tax=Dictyobacter aurantiacus TaxID=1936993 RepID=A0A401ZAQ6_9CHLR|nr:M3 family oligoendopeptidase [Dictyobacter aurantiacus]GCE03886.1 oligoendopeptidase F [Dictyobacter aurantiacus]
MNRQYSPLPQSSETFEQLQWTQIEPWYRELIATPLSDETLEAWLKQWSLLSALVSETNTWLEIATTRDTADETVSQRRQRFLDEIFTYVQPFEQQIKQQLLDSGLHPAELTIPLSKLRADAQLFRSDNIPLLNEEKKLGETYMSINGSQIAQWEGKEVPISSLLSIIQSPDRERRKQAWKTFQARKSEDYVAINEVWRQSVQIRQQIARNAGYNNYRDYRWQQLYRFDYTPTDCKMLHEAVERVVVPLAVRLAEKRRQLLGVETLRPWDLTVNARTSAEPRTIRDIEKHLRQCARMFGQIDPALGSYFTNMIKERCFDLDERPDKAPGGYNAILDVKQLPFIFGHAMNIQDILYLCCHEAGHAFHAFEARHLPYLHQRSETMIPIEFGEVASTSMEYIGAMHLASSGICTEQEAHAIRLQHLEETIRDLTRMMRGDAFQHWVYEYPEQAVEPEAVGQKWVELGRRFEPYLDWRELESFNSHGWQHTLHFFLVPFYYIVYAFATIGALQVWRNYIRDPKAAIRRYRYALSLGATHSLPDLYTAAGAKFAFDTETLQDVVQFITAQITELEM